MQTLPLDQIHVAPGRVRTEFDAQAHHGLANDIIAHGLLHPLVVDKAGNLLAGERRFRALRALAEQGFSIQCNAETIPPGIAPITYIHEMDEITRLQAEVSENIHRLDLTWQDRARVTQRLVELKTYIHGKDRVTIPRSGGEGANKLLAVPIALVESVAEIRNQPATEITQVQTISAEQDLIVAAWLEKGDEDVAKAPSRKEALKIIEQKLEEGHRRALSREFRAKVIDSPHTLVPGDCLELLPRLPDGTFDVILTDPPYGMRLNSHSCMQGGALHKYDDSQENSDKIAEAIFLHGFRSAKPKAHLYMFCDIRRFFALAAAAEAFGWNVWPRPLIWHRSDGSGILVAAEYGPRYGYEAILFASKGSKRVLHVAGDVLAYGGDRDERSAARKPVPLLVDLLKRSCLPGDYVLDPCAGSGPIIEAAHALELRSYSIEVSEEQFGLATKRLQGLGKGGA